MYEDEISIRLANLRLQKGVSARDMSLSLGLNPGYINNIECGKALPAMRPFLYICEYLKISPSDFFDFESKYPEKINELIKDLKNLNEDELDSVIAIVKNILK